MKMKTLGMLVCVMASLLAGCSTRTNNLGEREIVIRPFDNPVQTNSLAQVRPLLDSVTVSKIRLNGMAVSNAIWAIVEQQFGTNSPEKSGFMVTVSYILPDPVRPISLVTNDISYRKVFDEVCRQSDTFWALAGSFVWQNGSVTQAVIGVCPKEWFDEHTRNQK